MHDPFVKGAVLLISASFFSVVNRQMRAYSNGQPSYVSLLEGRYVLGTILIAINVIVCSALMTFLVDGSLMTFWETFAGLAAASTALVWWIWQRKRSRADANGN